MYFFDAIYIYFVNRFLELSRLVIDNNYCYKSWPCRILTTVLDSDILASKFHLQLCSDVQFRYNTQENFFSADFFDFVKYCQFS